MDLYAYSQIEDLEEILTANNIEISRLRGFRLMKNEEPISEESIKEVVEQAKISNAEQWLQNRCWWCSSCKDIYHKALIVKEDERGYKEVVGVDWTKIRRKDRKRINIQNKHDAKRIRENFEMFNSYCGKDVLYVHARQGGGNRLYCPIDTKHPLYLSDCDDSFDTTYCDIYYDLTNAIIPKE